MEQINMVDLKRVFVPTLNSQWWECVFTSTIQTFRTLTVPVPIRSATDHFDLKMVAANFSEVLANKLDMTLWLTVS
jgi:hypothetical protein